MAATNERSLSFSLSQVRLNRVTMVTALGTMVRRLVLKVLKPSCLSVRVSYLVTGVGGMKTTKPRA